MTRISVQDFEALIRRTGLPITPDEIPQIYKAWALVEPMLDHLRTPGRERVAEPANVFRPDFYAWPCGKAEAP